MRLFAPFLLGLAASAANVQYQESNTTLRVYNDEVSFSINKTAGAIQHLSYKGSELIGDGGNAYFDCFCVPSLNASIWSPSNPNPQQSRNHRVIGQTYEVHEGVDQSNASWVGAVMSELYASSGQFFQQWWFLREGESGIHTFTRLSYPGNGTYVNLGNAQEFRQVITPKSDVWTHLVTNEGMYATLPGIATGDDINTTAVTVQDSTTYYGDGRPYVQEQSDYFTKYEFADLYGDHKAHGFYGNDSETSLGLWWVFNSLEGYTGGPLRSDLVVDTNLYNYYLSNHRGAATLNITTGFDRVFGPSFLYMNANGSVLELLKDAESLATPEFDADFYDEIAYLVPGFATSAERGSLEADVTLPQGAGSAKLVLAQNGVDFQDAVDYAVAQYWANVSSDGSVRIPRVKEGVYRATIYADGIFGQYEQDDVYISAGNATPLSFSWEEESAGVELWRIGVPDKSAGEYRHGFARDANRTNHPEEYRAYWGQWDFPTDFPNGVNFTVGESDPAFDLNYIHFSRYGGTYLRPDSYVVDNVNEWKINFALNDTTELEGKTATFTVQLASARTASGNLDIPEPTSNYSDVLYSVYVNNQTSSPLEWLIPYNSSSSCSQRSGIACYNIRHQFEFPAGWLGDWNTFTLALPYNASGGDVNFRNFSVDVMYDAMRLEVSE